MSETKRLPRIYIAGPFTGRTAWRVEQNVRRAEEAAYGAARCGGFPITPHCNSRFFFGEIGEDFWVRGYLELLECCDAVFLCAGWARSAGSRAEAERAEALGIPLLFTTKDILDFIEKWRGGELLAGSSRTEGEHAFG